MRSPRFTSRSNKALATAPFANVVRRRPKPECVHSTSGRDSQRLPTTLNSLQASCVDRSVAQHHGCATQLQNHLVQHIARARRHKRAGRGRQARFQTVGPVRPTGEKSRWPAIGLSSTTTTKEPRLTAFRQNQTKNKTIWGVRSKEQDEEQDGYVCCFSKEQDREQQGFRSALGKKTTVLSRDSKTDGQRATEGWLSQNAR